MGHERFPRVATNLSIPLERSESGITYMEIRLLRLRHKASSADRLVGIFVLPDSSAHFNESSILVSSNARTEKQDANKSGLAF